jgi:hypothetical protein
MFSTACGEPIVETDSRALFMLIAQRSVGNAGRAVAR